MALYAFSNSNVAEEPPGNTTDASGAFLFGTFATGGQGLKLANTPRGDLNFIAWTYVRYLNRNGLDESYTDAFGRPQAVQKRNDIQHTVSGSIWWMPTTGEFGPRSGYGDFESHERLATLIGLSMTHSTEDRQSQPGVEDLSNTPLRLSDGTIIFAPNAFETQGRINTATYYMMSIDAAMKCRGLAIEGEYCFQWLQQFKTVRLPEQIHDRFAGRQRA